MASRRPKDPGRLLAPTTAIERAPSIALRLPSRVMGILPVAGSLTELSD